MDEQRFDSLTRSLARGRSRRNVLQGLIGGVAAGLFAHSAQPVEAESPRPLRALRNPRAPRVLRGPRGCRADQSPDCADGCCPDGSLCYQDLGCHAPDEVPCGNGSCSSGDTCTAQGMCLPPGGIECGSGYCEGGHVCVNGQGCLPPDSTACGGGYCTGGQVCLNGQCERACDAGTTRCGGACVDTASDSLHCGGCGVACTAGQVCDGGACSCPAGTELCGGDCVDPLTDLDHCGACDTPCQASACMDAACVEGQCQRTPIANCCTEDGDCDDGNPCTVHTCDPDTSSCSTLFKDYGESCPDDGDPCSLDICDGQGECIHPEVEDDHICITPDGNDGVCRDHLCVIVGPEPDHCEDDCSGTCCDEICTNLQTDPLNCGACSVECSAEEQCISGRCEPESGCPLTDWHQYVEWDGTFASVFDVKSRTNQDFDHVEWSVQARLRLEPVRPNAHAFTVSSYDGTRSVSADSLATNGAITTTEKGQANEAITDGEDWITVEVPTLYSREQYNLFIGTMKVPVEVKTSGGGSTSVSHVISELGLLPYVAGQGQPLPACPGPISGRYERYEETSYAVITHTVTWTLTPVGL